MLTMIDITTIFENRKADFNKLRDAGFLQTEDVFVKEYPVMKGEYRVKVIVSTNSDVDFRVYDSDNEEYILAHVKTATGDNIEKIHKACAKILKDISNTCFFKDIFKCEQSKRILQYIKEKYGAEPEFLWKILPDCAALRVQGNKSWFAVVGRIDKKKLGLTESDMVEVINLKDTPECVTQHIETQIAYPAYHMNKTNWYSLILDEHLSDEEIIKFIHTSYMLVDEP